MTLWMARVGMWLLGIALAGACGGASPSRAPAPTAEVAPPLPELPPLPALVPAGASLVAVARPRELLETGAVRHLVAAIALPEQLEAFHRRTGVDPRRLELAVVGQYEDGALTLARGPFDAAAIARAAGMRMNAIETASDEPFVRRRGFIGEDLYDVVALGADVVAVASGARERHIEMLRRARDGRWGPGAGAALAAADARRLVEDHQDAPAVLYAPRPLELPPGFGTSVLLARQRALAVTARPGPEELSFEIDVRGELPVGAEENFRQLATSVGRSDLGAALGIGEGIETLRIQTTDDSALLRMTISAATLARGLRALFVADIRELLEGPDGSPSGT